MFQRILVPLDGSKRAERALPVAARLARASGGTVILLSVATMQMDFVAYMAPALSYMLDFIGSRLDALRDYLDQVARLPVLAGTAVETRATYGQSAQCILSELHETKADLVVICSHGYTGLTRLARGSTAEKVAHHASVPVLILRQDGSALDAFNPEETQSMCALVPLDGSELARTAIEPAAELIAALAAPGRARLHLVRVIPALSRGSGDLEKEEEDFRVQRAKTSLIRTVQQINAGIIAPQVKKLNVTVTWSVVIDADIARGIARVAENGEDVEGIDVFDKCALIVIAMHGRGGLQRLTMGSVTERILHESTFPVLIVRPNKTASVSLRPASLAIDA